MYNNLENYLCYHDLNVQSNQLFLADVFEKFGHMCLKLYEVDSAHFFFCTRISMARSIKKD